MLFSEDYTLPTIDSHIHLYAASHLRDLAWTGDLPDEHILKRQNSVDEYRLAIKDTPNLLGFIFVETDRESGLYDDKWKHALEEIEFLSRIQQGKPINGEGHQQIDSELVLGIVPWAPVPAGKETVQRYLVAAKKAAGSEQTWEKVKGFRYLLQDKPSGLMLEHDFLEGLLTLELAGVCAFDLGVDARQGGLWQLKEAVHMLENFYSAGQSRLNIVINHLCKPNLRLTQEQVTAGHPDFSEWTGLIIQLANLPTTYIKLSGLFSELPGQAEDSPTPIPDLVTQILPWVKVVISAFGASRVMFASDWPVCNVGGPGSDRSWQHWYQLIKATSQELKLSREEQADVFAGTAVRAYHLEKV